MQQSMGLQRVRHHGGTELTEVESLITKQTEVTQSCPTLGDPMDDAVHGILQARLLE